MILLLILLSLSGCCRKIYPTTIVTDSVRVEYRDRIVKVVDTAFVEIPQIVEKVVTRDTASHLENSYAESFAVISDGQLYHSLETKPQTIAKPVIVEVPVQDTIMTQDHSEYIEKVVTETKYPKSYWLLLGFFFSALAFFVIKVAGKR